MKMFPIMSHFRDEKPHPTQIPWEVADKAYAVYRSRFGSGQSLERLAERGGFSWGEMDALYPGWRVEVDAIVARDARIAELEQACEVFAHCVAVETRNGICPDDPNYEATKRAHERVIENPLANGMVVKARDKFDAARAKGATE